MSETIGQPASRVDGRAKVTGAACYAAEFAAPGLAYAALVLSTVAKGRIADIATGEAERVPGVLAVVTHLNAPKLPYQEIEPRPPVDPKAGHQLRVFQTPDILFNGQPIGVVVADTREQARHAASLVQVSYDSAPAKTTFVEERGLPLSKATQASGRPADTHRGDPDGVFANARIKIDARYIQPREHHNPMEQHATIAVWAGDELTLYDKSQWVDNARNEIAHNFGIPETRVRVISPFVGGAFGSALRTWPHVTIAALAARQAGRPVLIELSRREMYTLTGFRPHTEQRVALGATEDGKLEAIIHEAFAQTSTYEEYAESTLEATRLLYSCSNVRTRHRVVDMNTNTPTAMRAPGFATGVFALETAMDELASALEMDPVELRLRNYAVMNEDKLRPWSSKELWTCYATAAKQFGWAERSPRPGSMHHGRTRIGYGMATAVYPAHRAAASASATLFANGTAVVRSAASDMGPGTYTAMTQVAADTLGLPMEQVRFELGDTSFPRAPVHGGSITMASVGNAVQAACEALRETIQARPGESLDAALRRNRVDQLEVSADAAPGKEEEAFSAYAFGAVFVEVRVDPSFGIVRVPRIVGAYDVGRVINPKLARSQCLGGMVGGIGMALLEEGQWDPRFGRVMNANMAEYLVPVNADVQQLEAFFVPSDDRNFNPLGVKGLAEVATCGVAPAIVNAIYHATGVRVRTLPVKPEALLPMTENLAGVNLHRQASGR